jgi:hypothetical protein
MEVRFGSWSCENAGTLFQKVEFSCRNPSSSRPAAAAPGLPPDRAEALRQAFDDTMADPEFREEARRTGLEIDGPIAGREVDAILSGLYTIPNDLVAKFEAIRDER